MLDEARKRQTLDEAVAYTRRMDADRKATEGENSDLENRFSYHTPSPEQVKVYYILRGIIKNTAYAIQELTPKCREQSLALTKLEEAIFFANAAIARYPT